MKRQMATPKYNVFQPVFRGNEKKYLKECIDTGWISSNGQFVKRLEKDYSKYCNRLYASCTSSGSGALDVTFRAMKKLYKWDDYSEVIMPAFNIISNAQSCIYNKLKPVFVDADRTSWNMDVNKIEQMITKKTKAINIVHIYGLTTDVNPVMEIAKKYNLKIIEDASQAHGQTYNGKKCGSFGDVSIFSFYANKVITSGEGGIVLTSDNELYGLVNYYKNICFSENKFVHQDIGWNYRMSNLQAAVACAQLENIEKTISIKKRIGKTYQKLLKNLPLQLPLSETCYSQNHYWVFGVLLQGNNIKDVTSKLKKEGIETRPFFYPMHKQPIFKKLGILDNIKRPVSEYLYEKGFYIPTGLNLKRNDIEYICEKIKDCVGEM